MKMNTSQFIVLFCMYSIQKKIFSTLKWSFGCSCNNLNEFLLRFLFSIKIHCVWLLTFLFWKILTSHVVGILQFFFLWTFLIDKDFVSRNLFVILSRLSIHFLGLSFVLLRYGEVGFSSPSLLLLLCWIFNWICSSFLVAFT